MQNTTSQKAVAAANKCYEFSYGKKVKVVKYYYRVNDEGALQRSKSKNKNFETVVNTSTAIYLSTGKLIYCVDYSDEKGTSTIYSYKMDGSSQKELLTTKKTLMPSIIYQNKLYLSSGSE